MTQAELPYVLMTREKDLGSLVRLGLRMDAPGMLFRYGEVGDAFGDLALVAFAIRDEKERERLQGTC
jgi:hypothetical protein